MKTSNDNQIKELGNQESEQITGGGKPITCYSLCDYEPSHFVDAHDPYIIDMGECCRCIYNHHRNWHDSICSYEEDTAQSKEI